MLIGNEAPVSTPHHGMSYDGRMSDPTPSGLARFAKFVRAVASVPKRELDAKLAAYEKRRRPARERRKRPA